MHFMGSLVLRRKWVLLGAVLLGLNGCVSMPQNEGAPASVSDVVNQIKTDLDAYQKYDAAASLESPLNDACKGIVGFYIDNVKISLTTQTDNTISGTASLTLPVGSGTFGPTGGFTQETKGTQTLTFSLYPKPVSAHDKSAAVLDPAKYPIAASLQRLREGLLEASKKEPCVSLIPRGVDGKPDPSKDAGGSYAYGFTVINTKTAGATLKFVVYSLGATGSAQRQSQNSITVTFKARPGSADSFRDM